MEQIPIILMARPCMSNQRLNEHKGKDPKGLGELISLSFFPYKFALQLQRRIRDDRIAGSRSDTLILLEHEPVLTLGQTTKDSHWKERSDMINKQGIQIIKSERGGSVTFHGPGQIVGYPILLLREFCSGPKTYMQMLEEVIIAVLEEWGIKGRRIEKLIGVWVEDPQNPDGPLAKIAALGVKISRGITTHGFALNVAVDLQPFRLITPCGIENCHVTSMTEVLGSKLDVPLVKKQVAHHFSRVFGIKWSDRVREVSDLPLPNQDEGGKMISAVGVNLAPTSPNRR